MAILTSFRDELLLTGADRAEAGEERPLSRTSTAPAFGIGRMDLTAGFPPFSAQRIRFFAVPATDQQHEDIGWTLELSNGVLSLRWSPNAVVNEAYARAVIAGLRDLCEADDYPLLIELTGIGWMGRRAQAVIAGAWPRTRVALLGSTPVDRVLAAFYLAWNTPASPTRFFSSVDEAMSWLSDTDPSRNGR